jgi:hypothetical protein
MFGMQLSECNVDFTDGGSVRDHYPGDGSMIMFGTQLSECNVDFTDGGSVRDHYPSDGGREGLLQEGVRGSEGGEEIHVVGPSHTHQGLSSYLLDRIIPFSLSQ